MTTPGSLSMAPLESPAPRPALAPACRPFCRQGGQECQGGSTMREPVKKPKRGNPAGPAIGCRTTPLGWRSSVASSGSTTAPADCHRPPRTGISCCLKPRIDAADLPDRRPTRAGRRRSAYERTAIGGLVMSAAKNLQPRSDLPPAPESSTSSPGGRSTHGVPRGGRAIAVRFSFCPYPKRRTGTPLAAMEDQPPDGDQMRTEATDRAGRRAGMAGGKRWTWLDYSYFSKQDPLRRLLALRPRV